MGTFNDYQYSEDGRNQSGEVADIVIMGAPFDLGASTSGGGMATAPTVIRNSYTAPGFDVGRLRVVDAGDVFLTDRSVRGAVLDVATNVATLSSLGIGTIVMLGGDDSVNHGISLGLHKPMPILHLDAHDDCASDVDMEDDFDHSSWVRHTAELAPIVTQVGLRAPVLSPKLPNVVRHDGGLSTVSVRNYGAGDTDLVVCVDMDVVDPAHAPGVGTPEPGGMTSSELLRFCWYLGSKRSVKVLSFTEVCPAKDVNDMTSRLVFRLILNYISGYAGHTYPH